MTSVALLERHAEARSRWRSWDRSCTARPQCASTPARACPRRRRPPTVRRGPAAARPPRDRSHKCLGKPEAGRRGHPGPPARGDRPAALGPTRCCGPRSTHTTRRHQGSRVQPAAGRRRVDARRGAGAARHHRGIRRPARGSDCEPARHEPPTSRRPVGAQPACRARRGRRTGAHRNRRRRCERRRRR